MAVGPSTNGVTNTRMAGEAIRAFVKNSWTAQLLVGHTRENLLSDLRALEPVIAALGGAQAVVETFHAIQDVGRWWP